MKTIEVKSQSRPIEIEETDEKVYIRNNIKKYIESDPVFGTESTFYTYDETQYTPEEWNRKNIETLQIAICELSGVFEITTENIRSFKANLEKNMSSVDKILIKLLKKELITMAEIKEPYRSRIKEYLKSRA